MLNVTEKARDALAKSLEASEAEEGQSFRLARSLQGDLGLTLDAEREGDQIVEQEGRSILIIDQEISSELDGAILDVAESPQGRRLALRMPEGA